VAVREGLEAWRGENCGCGPVGVEGDTNSEEDGAGCCGSGGCTDGCCNPSDIAATSAAPEAGRLPLNILDVPKESQQ
jgi:hypothetical protein